MHATVARKHLYSRMWRAGAWLLGSNIASQGMRLVSSLVLTRLLMPQAFGLVATIQTLYFALVMFSDLGVWQSIVTSARGREPRFLGTAMSVQVARGALLSLIVLFCAAGLAIGARYGIFAQGTVYTDSRLPWMMAVFSISALLQGAESTHLATAQRDLQTGLLTRIELLSQLAGTIVTISLAALTHSVWSLVGGTVMSTFTRTALSHVLLPGEKVHLCWDRDCAREIMGFGKWIFLSSLIGFAAANGEKILLAGTLPAASFGVFSIASTLLAAIIGLVGSLNAHLVFPGFSEALRSGQSEAARVYLRVQQLADLVLGIVAGGIFMCGGWVVRLLYDSRYGDAAWMFQLLGLGLLAIRFQVLEQMMFARGKPAWVTASNALRATCLVVTIPMAYAAGGERGALVAVVASQFVGWPVAVWFKSRQGLPTWRAERVWPLALAFGLALGWIADLALHALTRR